MGYSIKHECDCTVKCDICKSQATLTQVDYEHGKGVVKLKHFCHRCMENDVKKPEKDAQLELPL